MKVELNVRPRLWLNGYQQRCRDDAGYHQRSCLNRCFGRAVRRALNYSCGLDWFLDEGSTCQDPDQAYTMASYVDEQDSALLRDTDCQRQCPQPCRLNFFHFTPFSRTERPVLARHQLSVLTLSFRDTFYQLTREKLVYDSFTLFGEVGGALSLLLGMSLTSCMDGSARALDLLFRRLHP
ncbi:uncharacterized protein LOC122379568 [Amphibalanus amphitrite]|uniref:uncharacterized protein LOC122379568 n=1 Tax=Amphibalanus amphitrite TaxID=1232801 RepID=UPI001C91CF4B|nr:uncharacterized protein LOC122379568 [Amphibalanus amphitrite]XP_043217797.1 uncharacterized protein LOC122379568 [Amphibalanus amphitrite]